MRDAGDVVLSKHFFAETDGHTGGEVGKMSGAPGGKDVEVLGCVPDLVPGSVMPGLNALKHKNVVNTKTAYTPKPPKTRECLHVVRVDADVPGPARAALCNRLHLSQWSRPHAPCAPGNSTSKLVGTDGANVQGRNLRSRAPVDGGDAD